MFVFFLLLLDFCLWKWKSYTIQFALYSHVDITKSHLVVSILIKKKNEIATKKIPAHDKSGTNSVKERCWMF